MCQTGGENTTYMRNSGQTSLQPDITMALRTGMALLFKPTVAAALPEINARTRRIGGPSVELSTMPHDTGMLSEISAGVADGAGTFYWRSPESYFAWLLSDCCGVRCLSAWRLLAAQRSCRTPNCGLRTQDSGKRARYGAYRYTRFLAEPVVSSKSPSRANLLTSALAVGYEHPSVSWALRTVSNGNRNR